MLPTVGVIIQLLMFHTRILAEWNKEQSLIDIVNDDTILCCQKESSGQSRTSRMSLNTFTKGRFVNVNGKECPEHE